MERKDGEEQSEERKGGKFMSEADVALRCLRLLGRSCRLGCTSI